MAERCVRNAEVRSSTLLISTKNKVQQDEIMTADTLELVSMVESLPVDMRAMLVEKLLNSLQPRDNDVDEAWSKEIERRIAEIDSGTVQTVSGEKVFHEAFRRFGK